MAINASSFIFKGRGFSAVTHRADFRSAFFTMSVVGVSSVNEAHAVASALVADGTQVIELCGGFDAADAEAIAESIGRAVPVGVVGFSGQSLQQLAALRGAGQSVASA
jgi:2-keto-3-deoxy-6-phosphogluconate aldolase